METSWSQLVDLDGSSVEETSWDLTDEDDKSSSFRSGSIASCKDSRTFQRMKKGLGKTDCKQSAEVPSARSEGQILDLLAGLGYPMMQVNGQRRLGPPPGWTGPAPDPSCEVFVGKVPRDIYEDTIYPIFSEIGEIYEIRLMMDFSGTNRGYCFVMFAKEEYAQRAIKELNNFEIRKGNRIGVVASINNCRLCIGRLPSNIDSKTVIEKFHEMTDEVVKVGVYKNVSGHARYALVSYRTHRGAAMARRRLMPEREHLFKDCEVSIDWAQPNLTPSNVIEEMGVRDENGEIKIVVTQIGYASKRDKHNFLEKSIKKYLQSKNMTEQSPREVDKYPEKSLDRLDAFSGRKKNQRAKLGRQKASMEGKEEFLCIARHDINGNRENWRNRQAKSEIRGNEESLKNLGPNNYLPNIEVFDTFEDYPLSQGLLPMREITNENYGAISGVVCPYDSVLPARKWNHAENASGCDIFDPSMKNCLVNRGKGLESKKIKSKRASSRILGYKMNQRDENYCDFNLKGHEARDEIAESSELHSSQLNKMPINFIDESIRTDLGNYSMNYYIPYGNHFKGLFLQNNVNLDPNVETQILVPFAQSLPQSCFCTSSFANYPPPKIYERKNTDPRPILNRKSAGINDEL